MAETGAFGPGREFRHLRIERKLGLGGFATVWLAHDPRLERFVALKVFNVPDPTEDDTEQRVLEEARLLARLQSRHVVILYSAYRIEGGGWVFEMEYVPGGSLERVLRKGPRPGPERTLEILRGIARGLQTAHAAGIVHGDIKPANVLLDDDGTAKLADFGLARLLPDQSLAISMAGDPVGTPHYMAPEVYLGRRPTPASDLWSFGVMLYEFLAGRRAFDGANWNALFHAIQNLEPAPLDPSTPPELQRLVARCLAKDPAQRPSDLAGVVRTLEASAPGKLPPTRAAEPPLPAAPKTFGRQAEIAALEARLDQVLMGQGSAVLVTGEAGIGKTTLMHEVAAAARRRGFLWIESRIAPVEGLLRPLFRELRRHVTRTDLERRFGPSASVLEGALHAGARVFEKREQMVWALERLLEGLAADVPVGLLVEDAHQAGQEEIDLLAELGMRLAPSRTLLAVTYRLHGAGDAGSEGRERYHDLAARQEYAHLELRELDPEAVLSILETEAGVARVDPEVARRITHLAQGNPLFAKELLRHLVEQGVVICGKHALEPGPAWGRGRLPVRIQDLVAQRLAGLTDAQRQVLDVAAVDGLEFDGDAVAAVLELRLLEVLRLLQHLYRERGLVVPQPNGFRFAHPVTQEVIRDDTAPELRTAIHRRLAEHLETRGPDAGVDPERLGTHWERGGSRERAVPYLLEAARAAARRQEMRRAVRLCTRAGLDPGRLDQATALAHAETLLSLAPALADLQKIEQAETVYGALVRAAEQAADEQLRSRALVGRGRTLYAAKGMAVLDEEEMRRATRILPVPLRATAHYNLGLIAFARGDLDDALNEVRRADEIYAADAWHGGHSDALDLMGTVERERGNLAEAERLYAEAAQVSYRVGRRVNGAVSDINCALAAFDRGALEGLAAPLERSIATLRLEGSLGGAAHATVILSHVLYALGDLTGAERSRERARAYLRKIDHIPGLIAVHLAAAEFALVRGRLHRSARYLAAAEKAGEKSSKVYILLYAAVISVRRLCLAGKLEEAAREARQALHLAGEQAVAKARNDLLLALAEATVLGLPGGVLADLRTDELPAFLATVLAGARAFATPAGSPADLHAAAQVLLGPEIGIRRATLRIIGRWLEAEALCRESRPTEAEREARAALEDARQLGHVGLELRLLDVLYAWTGEESYEAQRNELIARSTTRR
ncbi:MAG: serine/threonine-protein kinase [Planctomycetota bacterium]|jgi:tetratricopeptide (TPR) repeat protein